MGYSLLKTVFPNFGETNMIANETFAEFNYKRILEQKVQEASFTQAVEKLPEPIEPVPIEYTEHKPLEQNPREQYDEIRREIKTPVLQDIPEDRPIISKIENFGNNEGHIDYSHILKCEECRKLLQNKYKKEQVLPFDESLIEIGLYILFGAFILALLDKKN